MNGTHYVILVLIIIFISPFIFKMIAPSLARHSAANMDMPAAWEKFLYKHLPLMEKLSPQQQKKLRKKLKILISEKNLESFEGLIRSDEMKIGILSYAALVGLNRSHYYEQLKNLHVFSELPESKKRASTPDCLVVEWSDDSGTPDPFSHWPAYHFANYPGKLSRQDFIEKSCLFFTSPDSLELEIKREMEKFYGFDSKIFST